MTWFVIGCVVGFIIGFVIATYMQALEEKQEAYEAELLARETQEGMKEDG